MAAKKKTTKKIEEVTPEIEKQEIETSVESVEPVEVPAEVIEEIEPKKSTKKLDPVPEKTQKFNIGDIVFISKEADTDLNGFKLFPQYKKYTYTVEAYDGNTGVYTLRRLNLSLKLKEELILAPSERAHDSINRRQF